MEKRRRGPKPGAPGAGRPPIGGAQREKVVAALRTGGSVRSVADATGVSLPTVRKIRDAEGIAPKTTRDNGRKAES
jgi:DNA invertase Pin-like site-specific DNA recombinase